MRLTSVFACFSRLILRKNCVLSETTSFLILRIFSCFVRVLFVFSSYSPNRRSISRQTSEKFVLNVSMFSKFYRLILRTLSHGERSRIRTYEAIRERLGPIIPKSEHLQCPTLAACISDSYLLRHKVCYYTISP